MTTRQPSPQPSPQSSPQRSARQASLAPLTVLLAAPRGFCAGVERAVAIVEETLKKHGEPVYVRHEIVHNAFVVETLQRQGVVFVEELEDILLGARSLESRRERGASTQHACHRCHLPVGLQSASRAGDVSVRREDDGARRSVVVRDVFQLFDEDDALALQGFDDEGVM